MTRPKVDITKVQMSYNIVAPRMYKGKTESLVSRMTSFADMIQITHLKLTTSVISNGTRWCLFRC